MTRASSDWLKSRLKPSVCNRRKRPWKSSLKAKYQPRIKEQKDVIAVQEYELEKLEQQYQKDMLDLDDWKKKAEAERTAKLRKLEEEKQRIAAELKEIDGKLNNLNREKSEKLNQPEAGMEPSAAGHRAREGYTGRQHPPGG